MAEKDITEKILEGYNDVFADIVNVLLFDGERVINADELAEHNSRASYKADGKIREIERDVAKHWSRQNIHIACIGCENQTKPDRDMPLRVIGYDGAEYRAELQSHERYPVVTLVLYFGYDRHWNRPKSLLECFNVPEVLKRYVNDYKINLFEIAFLPEKKRKMFTSDFGVVVDFFNQMRENGNYLPGRTKINHVQEVLQLLSIMTGDYRFEQVCELNGDGRPQNMCEVLDRIENRGIRQGIRQGIKQGIKQGKRQGMNEAKKEVALGMKKDGLSEALIAKYCGVSTEKLKKWFE